MYVRVNEYSCPCKKYLEVLQETLPAASISHGFLQFILGFPHHVSSPFHHREGVLVGVSRIILFFSPPAFFLSCITHTTDKFFVVVFVVVCNFLFWALGSPDTISMEPIQKSEVRTVRTYFLHRRTPQMSRLRSAKGKCIIFFEFLPASE